MAYDVVGEHWRTKLLAGDDLSIDLLELPARAWRMFQRENIKTVGDLCILTKSYLMRMPNLGRKSIAEIEAELKMLGRSLAPEVDMTVNDRMRLHPMADAPQDGTYILVKWSDGRIEVSRKLGMIYPLGWWSMPEQPNGAVPPVADSRVVADDELSTDVLDVSVRSSNVLKNAGIKTVGDLCQLTQAGLRALPNMGGKSFAEIEAELDKLGRALRT